MEIEFKSLKQEFKKILQVLEDDDRVDLDQIEYIVNFIENKSYTNCLSFIEDFFEMIRQLDLIDEDNENFFIRSENCLSENYRK